MYKIVQFVCFATARLSHVPEAIRLSICGSRCNVVGEPTGYCISLHYYACLVVKLHLHYILLKLEMMLFSQ